MIPSKYLWPVLIITGITLFVFYNESMALILGLLGLGGANELTRAKKAKIIADEHEDLMNHDVHKAIAESQKASQAREIAQEAAEDITKRNEVVNKPSRFNVR